MYEILKQNKVFRISMVTLIIGVVTLVILGMQITKYRERIQQAQSLTAAGQNVQKNFEENLRAYQETHEKRIQAIQNVRPKKEDVIVPFVNALETIGQTHNISINISNIETNAEQLKKEASPFVQYLLSLDTEYKTAIAFLQEIEKLPYFIKISSFSFQNGYNTQDSQNTLAEKENTHIVLKLYVKDETTQAR